MDRFSKNDYGPASLVDIINADFKNVLLEGETVRCWVRTVTDEKVSPSIEHIAFDKKNGSYTKIKK